MIKRIAMSFAESRLRGLKETPLRALECTALDNTDVYAFINTMSQDPRLDLVFPSNVTVPKRNILTNMPFQFATGSYDAGDNPNGFGVGFWDRGCFGGDIQGWNPPKKPVTEWTIAFWDYYNIFPSDAMRYQGAVSVPIDDPARWRVGEGMTINGFVVWPAMTPQWEPAPPLHIARCIGNARAGACLTLCKVGITGVVTVHDIISRPTGPLDGGRLSACNAIQSKPVDIKKEIYNGGSDPYVSNWTGSVPPENYFTCPPAKALCFWLGKTFADLPNDGPPHHRPVDFNPLEFGLFSSYSSINPPYP